MPDLTLPPQAPTERYQDGSYSGLAIAVYTLVDLGPGGGEVLIRALEASDENLRNTCRLAPQSNFAGQALRAVYDYHLEHVAPSRSYYPTLFIVSVSLDYTKHGVLLVNLDVDVDCQVDICRLSLDDAALDAVNLMISNEDWEDVKDHELPAMDTVTEEIENVPRTGVPPSH